MGHLRPNIGFADFSESARWCDSLEAPSSGGPSSIKPIRTLQSLFAASRHAENNFREDVWVCFIEFDVYHFSSPCSLWSSLTTDIFNAIRYSRWDLDLDSSFSYFIRSYPKTFDPQKTLDILWKFDSINAWHIMTHVYTNRILSSLYSTLECKCFILLKRICLYMYKLSDCEEIV